MTKHLILIKKTKSDIIKSILSLQVCMLNEKLSDAERMTCDVLRDLLGVKIDMTNVAVQNQETHTADRIFFCLHHFDFWSIFASHFNPQK